MGVSAAPRDVDDLLGTRASSGDDELEDRGYRYRREMRVRDTVISYWWNSRRGACIAVTTEDGRYEAIKEQPESMCGEDHGNSRGPSNGRYRSSTPEIREVDGGNLAVDMGGCNVLFNRGGRIVNQGSSCSRGDVNEARDALDSYMREQGSYASDEAPLEDTAMTTVKPLGASQTGTGTSIAGST